MTHPKKLLLLGGLPYLIPIIREAHNLGVHVITADYLPNNIAHHYSDEYCNVSIIDKDAVLEKAKELQIDGILSHAVDPGVTTAAYVAEQLKLPFQCSYQAACILQDKSLFRQFLSENGFNSPKAKGYTQLSEALNDAKNFKWPVIIKPVDSAGSKGVSKVNRLEHLPQAINMALSEAHNGHFIIEEFLEKEGYSIGSESFVVDGKLMYNGFYDQYFDNEGKNPYVPTAEIWPSLMKQEYLEEIKQQLQRLFSLLQVRTGLFNVECRLCTDGKLYLMEVSPRGGGNRLAEMLNYAADVNINEAETRKALGLPIAKMHEPNYRGHFAIYVLHSQKHGVLQKIDINKDFENKHLLEVELRCKPGDSISDFSGANAALGTLFLQFESRDELDAALKNINHNIHIDIQ